MWALFGRTRRQLEEAETRIRQMRGHLEGISQQRAQAEGECKALRGLVDDCRGCSARNQTINILQVENGDKQIRLDNLLDRIVSMAGVMEARLDALSVPGVDRGDIPPGPPASEAEQIEKEEMTMTALADQARKEQEAWAEANSVPIEQTYDVGGLA